MKCQLTNNFFKNILSSIALLIILNLQSCHVFDFFRNVNVVELEKSVTNYLDNNGLNYAWDITIITPKKIPKGEKTQIIVFYRLEANDYRSYADIIYDGSNYKINNFNIEANNSRQLAVPRSNSSITIDVKSRTYPFKGVSSLEFKCQLVDNKYFVAANPSDKIILNNSHIKSIEPYPEGEFYKIRIYLTNEGAKILNNVAKNDYTKKLGLKIGFVSYTTQAIFQNQKYEWITIYTHYSLNDTNDLIKSLLNKRDSK